MLQVNKDIYEASVIRQINLLRNRESLSLKIRRALTSQDIKFRERLIGNIYRLSEKDLKRLAVSQGRNTDAIKSIKSTIKDFTLKTESLTNSILDVELNSLTFDEYEFYRQVFNKSAEKSGLEFSISEISKEKAGRYRARELVLGQTQGEVIRQWSERRGRKLMQQIRISAQYLDKELISAKIGGKGSRLGGILKDTHFGGVLESNTLHAAATSAAVFAIRQENEKAFDIVWMSHLDSKTSGNCFSKHNKRVEQRPPSHKNCRSRVVPIFGSSDVFPEESIRVWFSRQTEQTQVDILGKVRFNLYQDSATNLVFPRDFVSEKGDMMTLEELRSSGKIAN